MNIQSKINTESTKLKKVLKRIILKVKLITITICAVEYQNDFVSC